MEEGLGGSPLTTKLLVTSGFREEGVTVFSCVPTGHSTRLRLVPIQWFTQMAMIKLNRPQNQAKSQEFQKGTGKEEQKIVKEGKEIKKKKGQGKNNQKLL